jgi:ComF family protein
MIPKERSRLYRKLPPKLRHLLSACRTSLLPPLFTPLLHALLHPTLNIPHRCALCDSKTSQRICTLCQQQFLYAPRYQCSVCALPLAHSALLCGGCLKKMPTYDRVHSPYLYQAPLSKLIFQFKEQRNFYTGQALADIWCNRIKQHMIQQHIPLPDMMTAVPLHWRKQYQRGFNQSAFFAGAIHKKLNIPLFTHVKRTQSAVEQKHLDRKKRLKNLEHSFTVTSPLNNAHVVIVDDVMTTGATANALAIALKKAGASKVSVWVLARVPKQ